MFQPCECLQILSESLRRSKQTDIANNKNRNWNCVLYILFALFIHKAVSNDFLSKAFQNNFSKQNETFKGVHMQENLENFKTLTVMNVKTWLLK